VRGAAPTDAIRSMPEPLQPAPPRQIIRNAEWLVAWDEASQSHVYRRDVDLTVEGEYRDVMQMLVDVEKMPVILVTENGLIHPGQGASGESKDFVSMTLRGSVVSLPQGL